MYVYTHFGGQKPCILIWSFFARPTLMRNSEMLVLWSPWNWITSPYSGWSTTVPLQANSCKLQSVHVHTTEQETENATTYNSQASYIDPLKCYHYTVEGRRSIYIQYSSSWSFLKQCGSYGRCVILVYVYNYAASLIVNIVRALAYSPGSLGEGKREQSLVTTACVRAKIQYASNIRAYLGKR